MKNKKKLAAQIWRVLDMIQDLANATRENGKCPYPILVAYSFLAAYAKQHYGIEHYKQLEHKK